MEEQFRYQHYRCVVADIEPSTTELREGEIAVNLYAGKEKMFIKNTNNEIVRFIPEEQIDEKITSKTDEKIQSLSGAIDSNTANIETLQISASTLNAEKFGDARYAPNTKRINFYSSSNENRILSWIDTTDIFDGSNYYTKTETDDKLNNLTIDCGKY
jgi:hypothetical protein